VAKAEGLSDRTIARSTRLARSTVADYAGRAAAAELSWPMPEGLTDTALEALLFVRGRPVPGMRHKPEPDWAVLHRELRRPGVTLMPLWQEYRANAPEGYGCSRFCELYDEWESGLSPTMRQVHWQASGCVDYAGQMIDLVDGRTGEVRTAQVFHKGERVASHLRGGARGRHTTVPVHMPSAHRRYA
jgi:transposase